MHGYQQSSAERPLPTVDSFPITEAIGEAGTVQALEAPTPPYYTCGCTTGASYLEALLPAAVDTDRLRRRAEVSPA